MPEEVLNVFSWEFLKGIGGLLVGTAVVADVIRVLLSEASKLLGPKWAFTYKSVPRWLKMTIPFLAGFLVATAMNPLSPEEYAHPIAAATFLLGVGSAFAHALYKPLLEKITDTVQNRDDG